MVSIGMLSVWVTRNTARKLITGLADALIASEHGARVKPRDRNLLESTPAISTWTVAKSRPN
jgi:hypothetical protein